MLRLIFISLLVTCAFPSNVRKATVKMGGTAGVSGSVNFTQNGNSVIVEGVLRGLTPGLHGFHVHSLGDITTCDSAGPHFNPFNQTHGAPTAAIRHVGDLGNIKADQSGVAMIKITDNIISLRNGKTSIVGRSLVVHANVDDLGLGGNAESRINGNSGTRLACGVIGILY